MILQYKPHIDGLRAIAILSVIFFHLELSSFFKGGFIGVDIFFVISGFLITSIIFKQIKNKTFTLKKFYIKRFRRIFPTLIFTIISVFIISIVVFLSMSIQI